MTLLDTWWSVWSGFHLVEKWWLDVDEFKQIRKNKPPNMSEPDFGFTFVLKRSSKHRVSSRQVYTILMFLGDVGGLSGAIFMLLAPIFNFFVPSCMTSSIINNFSYDQTDK